MKTITKLIITTFSLALVFLYLISNKAFIVTNYVGKPISVMNFQYEKLDVDPTISEMESYEDRYIVQPNQSKIFKVLIRNRLNNTLYIGIDFFYSVKDPEESEYYNSNGTTFSSESQYANQQAYCKFQIDVYPNRKTIVTPTRKWGCINPMYYHKSSFKVVN